MTRTDTTFAAIRTKPPMPRPAGEDARQRAAVALESVFLSEMLKHAGFGDGRQSFGGGIGEAQFASLLRDIEARHIAEAGGLGLAEGIVRALARSER